MALYVPFCYYNILNLFKKKKKKKKMIRMKEVRQGGAQERQLCCRLECKVLVLGPVLLTGALLAQLLGRKFLHPEQYRAYLMKESCGRYLELPMTIGWFRCHL